jgi:formylglycine-generating enzyme required for sulfatase activity
LNEPTTKEIQAAMLSRAVPLEATVFLMGCEFAGVHAQTRARAEKRNLSLGSLLAPTPPKWVRLPAIRIGRSLVTNGEYRDFLRATSGATGDRAIFDDPELWRYVWRGLGYRVEQQRVWLVRADGPPASQEERYDQIDNFVDAYIQSLKHETGRILAGPSAPLEPTLAPGDDVVRVHGDDGTTFAVLKRDPIVDRVFAALAQRLGSGGGASARAAPGRSRRTPAAPVSLEDLDHLVGRLEERMSASVAAQPQLFGRPGLEPEPLVFLLRCRDLLEQDPARPIRLHEVLYPRSWLAPEGEPPPLFAGPDVPWEDRPVLGITLYEALAFVLWLSSGATPGDIVTLPTEAELERAASWPDVPSDEAGPEGPPLDRSKKDIYPWQRQFELDFHEIFGGESKELAHYFTSRAEYERLVAGTSRPTSRGDRIEMLLGFGWQWTSDRFDEEERKYSRFDDGTCPFAFDRPRVDRQGLERTARVYDYVPNRAVRHGSFVVRGAPDLIGGEGLTTRRFALNPLRGYPTVGFRWVARRG